MIKKIILFIIVISIFAGAYKFVIQFTTTAQRKAEESLSVPQIGAIIKGAKGLKKTSEENVQKYDDSSTYE
ncbi:MAG: hypothetical protein ACRENO_06740 [Thermodesulfobacteriota bacterium]